MPKNKKMDGDEDLKPIDLPEEEDDKGLPTAAEEDELFGDDLDEEEEVEDEGDGGSEYF